MNSGRRSSAPPGRNRMGRWPKLGQPVTGRWVYTAVGTGPTGAGEDDGAVVGAFVGALVGALVGAFVGVGGFGLAAGWAEQVAEATVSVSALPPAACTVTTTPVKVTLPLAFLVAWPLDTVTFDSLRWS